MMNTIKKIRTKTFSQLIKLLYMHGLKMYRTARYHSLLFKQSNERITGLNLGSSNSIVSGFINIDASWCSLCDVVADVKRIKFRDNSVGTLFSSHVFEHFGREEAKEVLKEWFRIIEADGYIYISVPDVETLFNIYLKHIGEYNQNKSLVDDACTIVFGGQLNKYDYHYYGYSFITLKDLLESTGFTDVVQFDPREVDFMSSLGPSALLAKLADKEVSLNIKARKPGSKTTDAC